MDKTEKEFNPHLIRTKMIKHKAKYSAYTTWKGLDIQEYGETERNAVLFLLERHSKFLGITDIKSAMNSIGFYA